jgi:hypothetical protein
LKPTFMPTPNFTRTFFSLLLSLVVSQSALAAGGAVCEDLFAPVKNSAAVAGQRDLASVKEIKLMAYNVENMFMRLGKFAKMSPEEFKNMTGSELKPANELEGLAVAIKDENPDFIVMEEVEDVETLAKFAQDYLGGVYQPFLVTGNDQRGIQIGYLVKKDLPLQVTLESHKDATWVDPNDNRQHQLFSRDAPALMIRRQGAQPDSAPALIFIGHHAKAQRDRGADDPGSNILRTAQMKEVGSIIDDYQSLYGKEIPIVLGGDFNIDVRKAADVQPIRDRMRDPFDIKGLIGLDRTTHTYHPRQGSAQFHQLDALFVTPSLADNVVSIKAYRYKDENGDEKPLPQSLTERARNPSDHFPVVVTLSTEDIFPEAYLVEPEKKAVGF